MMMNTDLHLPSSKAYEFVTTVPRLEP